jgi:hypothetical protein
MKKRDVMRWAREAMGGQAAAAGCASAALLMVYACGPRVSVGDLGDDGGTSAGGQGSASETQSGGAPLPVGGADQGGAATGGGGVMSESGAPGGGGSEAAVAGATGGAGESNRGCASDLTQFLPAVEVTCPDDKPNPGDACSVAENGICVWQTGVVGQGNVGYEVMGCYSASDGKRWYGASQGNVGPVGSDPQNCPKSMPEAETTCAGHAGESCYYPLAACSCADDGDVWACTENVKPNLVPRVVERLCPPDGVDESKRIDQLSSTEVEAWCRWYASPDGAERPPISGIDPPGLAVYYATSYTDVNFDACVMDLPFEYCVQNFATRPSCTASLLQLDDCVESVFADPGGWVGQGCGPFLTTAGCEGLIVQLLPEGGGPSDCKVALE